LVAGQPQGKDIALHGPVKRWTAPEVLQVVTQELRVKEAR